MKDGCLSERKRIEEWKLERGPASGLFDSGLWTLNSIDFFSLQESFTLEHRATRGAKDVI